MSVVSRNYSFVCNGGGHRCKKMWYPNSACNFLGLSSYGPMVLHASKWEIPLWGGISLSMLCHVLFYINAPKSMAV